MSSVVIGACMALYGCLCAVVRCGCPVYAPAVCRGSVGFVGGFWAMI